MKTKNPCAYCGKPVLRFHARDQRPFKFCTPECDKANMGFLASIRFSGAAKLREIERKVKRGYL